MSTRNITYAQMDEKMKKGLCYHYDEKWNPSHGCKNLRVYTLEGSEDISEISSSENWGELAVEHEIVEAMVRDVDPKISIHAITSTPHSSTMRLQGWIGAESIIFLIHSGSTHNFVDNILLPKLSL